jgi:hypothetical protein
MPLFDFTACRSEEPAALYQCRELLAALTATQELLEVGSADAARALIKIGPADPPEQGDEFTVTELKNRHAWGLLRPVMEQDSLLVSRSIAVAAVSEKEGVFALHWHRQVRDVEYHADGGRDDAYLYFLDVTNAIHEQLVEAADLNLAVSQVKRLRGPFYNPREDWPAQGRYLWADFVIAWGGSERAE